MVCVFETIDDFIAIDPLNLGFDPKFIKELNLSKEETKKMVRDLVKFRKCLHTKQEDIPDINFFRNFIGQLLQCLKSQDAYVLYREIVKRY